MDEEHSQLSRYRLRRSQDGPDDKMHRMSLNLKKSLINVEKYESRQKRGRKSDALAVYASVGNRAGLAGSHSKGLHSGAASLVSYVADQTADRAGYWDQRQAKAKSIMSNYHSGAHQSDLLGLPNLRASGSNMQFQTAQDGSNIDESGVDLRTGATASPDWVPKIPKLNLRDDGHRA